jgi:hypothetical protein
VAFISKGEPVKLMITKGQSEFALFPVSFHSLQTSKVQEKLPCIEEEEDHEEAGGSSQLLGNCGVTAKGWL